MPTTTPSGFPREIDHRTIKLIVGVVAVTLPILTHLTAPTSLNSISAAYWAEGPSHTIFIGDLFAIAALLLSYNGYSKTEMRLSKAAGFAGLGVALFPCGCDGRCELVPYVHWICAGVMFATLAYFCYGFYKRALEKGHKEAQRRAGLYAFCGFVIVAAMVTLLLGDHLDPTDNHPDLTFWGETFALEAFGVSWLVASRIFPVVTRKDERFSPLRDVNPA